MIETPLPKPGQNWYGYEIITEIGRGGMAIVYKARQTSLSREVALKIINTNNMVNHIKRFQREIEISVQLDHPKIAKLYKFERINELIVIVMEYVDGKPLHRFLKKNKISLDEKLNMFTDILKGIEYAHKKNIIHRNIKPSNILVTNNKEIKIIDFGIARQVGREFDLTKTGVVIGTPRYMAPEQISGKKDEIDQQTDIYALGAVFYEMLVGQKMISEGSMQRILYNIHHEKIVSPKNKNVEVTTGLENIWQKAVARNKKQRYQTIQEFIKDIGLFIDGGKVQKKYNLKYFWISIICLILMIFVFLFKQENHAMLAIETIVLEEQKILDAIDKEEYEVALDIYLANPDYRYNYLLNRGVVLCCDELRKQAIEALYRDEHNITEKYLQKIIKIFPYDVESLIYLVEIRCDDIFKISETENLLNYKKGEQKTKLEEAYEYLQKCIEIEPRNSEYFRKMAIIKLALQEYEDGVTHLRKSLELDKDNVDTLKFLYEVPYYIPYLQAKCYTDCINLVSTIPHRRIYVDLHEETFSKLQKKYTYDYFQFLVSRESQYCEILFLEALKTLEQKEKNSHLKNKLLYFKYVDNFEEKMEEICQKFWPSSLEYKFLQDVIVTAKEQKEKEYERFCYYQITYMYNKKSWQNAKRLGVPFQKKLSKIIFCSDSERKNVFITFLAIKAYIEAYGFIDAVMGLEQENICTINKILLTAILRSNGIPITTEVFSLWSQEKYKSMDINATEEEFIACTMAKALYCYIEAYPKDTFYRNLDKFAFPCFHPYEKQLLDKLVTSKNKKIKVSALMSIYGSLNPGIKHEKEKNKDILLQIKSLLENSPLEIRQYVYSLFWQKPNHIETNFKEFLDIYYMGIQEDDLLIKHVLISTSYTLSHFSWERLEHLRAENINKNIQGYLQKIIQKNTSQNMRTKENILLSLQAISHLALLSHVNYQEIKEYLAPINCTVFEKMFGLITKVEAGIEKGFTEQVGQTMIKFWQDVQQETEPYFKVFSIYFFSRMSFYQNITPAIEKNSQVLQATLYSLYYDIDVSLENGQKIRDIPFLDLIIPPKTQFERNAIAQKYWLQKSNKDIKFAALASYIPLLVNERERDIIFEEAIISNDPQFKKIAALGFRRCIEQKVNLKISMNLNNMAEDPADLLYLQYLTTYTILLQKKENSEELLNWEKWYEYAIKLDSQSSYLLEQALLFFYGKNDNEKAKEILDKAIDLDGKNKTINSFLHYYKIKLFDIKSSESLKILVKENFLENKLAQFCLDKYYYAESLLLYQKMIIAKPMGDIQNFYKLLECLLHLKREQETYAIFKIVYEIFKRKHCNEKEKEVFNKERFIQDIPREYPLLYDFVRKQ